MVQVIHFSVVLVCGYIVAVYIEPIIYTLGFLPIETGNTFWVYLSIISLFCIFQMLFRGLLQLFFSAPLIMTTLADILSFSPCVVLIAHISGYFQEIPYVPARILPIFYLCLFIGLHFFFKLIVLFTSVYGKACSRGYSVFWFLVVFVLTYISLLGLIQWKHSLIRHRFFQVKTSAVFSDGKNQTMITEVPEGSFVIQPFPISNDENCVWFIRAGNKFLSTTTIFLYVIFSDKRITPFVIPLQVSRDTWTEMCLKDYLPNEGLSFIISWSSYRLPVFLIRQGLAPQFSLKSLEEVREFVFSEQRIGKMIYKTVYMDGPYCEREVTGEVVVR